MADDKSPDTKSEKDTKVETPGKEQPEKVEVQAQAPLKDLPEKLKDKSAEEIADMYTNLEKKLGKNSKEIEEARKSKDEADKYLSERNLLAQAVQRNPELYKMLDNELKSIQGGATTESKKEGGGEAQVADPRVSELRRAEENRAIADFEFRFGLNKLEKSERQDIMKKVSTQLADLVDPGGQKSMADVLGSIGLEKLPKYLENAYWLANKDSLMDKGRLPDQDTASIGSMASSSGKSDEASLTDRERNVANRLGVKPDQYLKQKQGMLET